MTSAEPASAVRARYDKWLWEAAKVIGASSIAAIIALQIGITRQQEQMNVFSRDIADIRAVQKEIMASDRRMETMLHDSRNASMSERRELERSIENVRDMLRQHELEIARRDLENERLRQRK